MKNEINDHEDRIANYEKDKDKDKDKEETDKKA
jgi:hypothetical protein